MSNKEISEIGIKTAIEYEREHGRKPEDVSNKRPSLGYDILSGDRKIEVKGQKGTWGEIRSQFIYLTPNEIRNATHLYVVCEVFDSTDLHIFELSKIPLSAIGIDVSIKLHMARCRDYELKE